MATFTPIDTSTSVNDLKERGLIEISSLEANTHDQDDSNNSDKAHKNEMSKDKKRGVKAGHVPLGIVIDKSCRVYIRNIPVERIERDGALALKAEFESFGPVESYKLFTERSGRFVGSALCTYRNPADATLAIREMNGREIDSATLQVMPAKEHGVVFINKSIAKSVNNNSDNNNYNNANYESNRFGDSHHHQMRSGRPRGFLPDSDEDDNNNNNNNSLQWQHTDNANNTMHSSEMQLHNNRTSNSGKWRHDKYEMQLEGRSPEEIFGVDYTYSTSTFSPFTSSGQGDGENNRFRGRGRGRGWGRGQRWRSGLTAAERTEREFEKYIAERDNLLNNMNTELPFASEGDMMSRQLAGTESNMQLNANASPSNNCSDAEEPK